MRRLISQYRSLIFLAAVLIAAISLSGGAVFAQPAKIFVVKSSAIASYNQAIEGFQQQALSEWTFVEYNLEGTTRNSANMIKKLEAENPDIVIAVGAKALAALTQSKVSQPVVFCMAMKPSTYDLQNLDITGVCLTVSPKDQLEVLNKLSSRIERVGILMQKKASPELLSEVNILAKKYKLKLIPIEIENEDEIPRKLRPILNSIDALWMLDDAFIHSEESLDFVIANTLKRTIPFMAISEVFVREGALISLSPSFFNNGKQAAKLVKRILTEKESPRNIPISFHENPDMIINLKTARTIELTVPLELLDKATKTYK